MDVDLPVVEYLPYFQLADPRGDQITVRHLLGHSSGLPFARPEEEVDQYSEFYNDYWYGDTPEGYVRSLTDTGLLFDPGAMFSYSDTGYDTLADVIEKVSGKAFPEYCKEHIFDPLGMSSSSFRVEEVDPANLANAYEYNAAGELGISPVFPYSQRHWPSSCLHSNIEDMARWIAAHFNHGKLGQSRILQAANQKELWEPLAETEPGIWYGWGWFCGALAQWVPDLTLPLPSVRGMFGGQIGVQSAFNLDPKSQFGVLVYAPLGDRWVTGPFSAWTLAQLTGGKCCHPVTPVGQTRLLPWRP
jgi:CubicO group peptidase (beta-lactamase class C family)